MTDNSSAEKAALQATWPEATQLLCHFHVAQAEWRWLHAAAHQVSRDERRDLMTAFQKVGAVLVCDAWTWKVPNWLDEALNKVHYLI